MASAYRSGFFTGVVATVAARALLPRLLLLKLNRDVRRLNAGDHEPLLAGYAQDAVLHFNDGPHRWAGEHRGRVEIDRFLRNFTSAGVQGEIRRLWIAGPPWALTMVARFDDHANGPDGEQIYANRTVLVVRTRWGKIVEHEDFYEDTDRIVALEEKLLELGITPVGDGPADLLISTPRRRRGRARSQGAASG
jgi:ketosteroid isomerase-like protein